MKPVGLPNPASTAVSGRLAKSMSAPEAGPLIGQAGESKPQQLKTTKMCASARLCPAFR